MKKLCLISLAFFVLLLSLMFNLYGSSKAYIGITVSEVSQAKYEKLKFKDGYGLQVTRVAEESPAMKAGILKNDLLLTLDGTKIYTEDQLIKMLSVYEPGKKIKMTLWRDGEIKEIILTLEENKQKDFSKRAYLGIILEELEKDDFEELGLSEHYGVEIQDIVDGGPSEKAGLEDDDVILEISGEKIYTPSQVTKMLKLLKPGDTVKVLALRDKKEMPFDVILGETSDSMDEFLSSMPYCNTLSKAYSFTGEPEKVFVYKYAKDSNGMIGVILESLGKEDQKKFGVTEGALITKVLDDSPAENAGLKKNDVIIKIDGKNIKGALEAAELIKSKKQGAEIDMEIKRDDQVKSFKINLEKWCDDGDEEEEKVVEVSVDDGNVKIIVNGEEQLIYDSQKMLEGIESLKKLEDVEDLDITEHPGKLDDVKKLRKKVKIIKKQEACEGDFI